MDDNEDISEPDSDIESDTEKPKIVKKLKISDAPEDSGSEFESDADDDIEGDDAELDAEDDGDIGSVSDVNEEDRAKLNIPHFDEIEDNDDEDEDDADENYLQKFDENLRKNVIADYHPEMVAHNYSEIDALSAVVRDENGVIIDPLHKTLPFITRYEKARILGERAKQLNAGAKPFVEVPANLIDGYLIALKEFEEKKIPFIVKRPLPGGGIEYWKFRDLEVLV